MSPPRRPLRGIAPALAALFALGASSPRATLPGADPFPAELAARLERAAANARDAPPSEQRTGAAGAPRYVNRLILEGSPYLLQHAHDPVDWYPWGDEAFARARRERRPVLLGIGYSSCHWCHVMARESFADEGIAALLNRRYVAILVDREERPDVDAVYMAAAQQLGDAGGWPLLLWLAPDRVPFYATTYLPPHDGPRSPGFMTLLERLRAVFDAEPARVGEAGAALVRGLERALAPPAGASVPGAEVLRVADQSLRAHFDAENGGFGTAPKFARSPELALLLRVQRRTGDARPREMVERSLAAMAAGGIRDRLGGGFHRYATDAQWRVPHFEKMLSDNALLAAVYLDAYQVTRREDFARVARETLDYLLRELRAPDGSFYSAGDADSEGVEGLYYGWTCAEVEAVLGAGAASRLVCAHYGVDAETRRALFEARPLAEVAAELGIPGPEAQALLEDARARLLRAREQRVAPRIDRKVLAAWNGLAISALARGGLVLREPAYVVAAARAAEFVRARLVAAVPGSARVSLRHAFVAGRAQGEAFLDDYAFVIAGLLELFEVSGDAGWLSLATALQAELDARFWDREGGGYFFTAEDQERLLAREKPVADGAVPSGNAVAVMNLLRLEKLGGDVRHRERAERALLALSGPLASAPAAPAGLAAALDFRSDAVKEIAIVTPRPGDEAELLDALARAYVPNRVLVVTSAGAQQEALAALVPWVAGKPASSGRATAYVCENRVCSEPTSDPSVLARQLSKAAPLEAARPPGP